MKSFLISILLLSFIFTSNPINAQLHNNKARLLDVDSTKPSKKNNWQKIRPLTGNYWLYPWEGAPGFKTGIVFNRSILGEVGIINTDIPKHGDELYAFNDIALTSEFNFNYKHFIIGPKFSLEFNILFLGVKGSFIYYSDFKDKDLRLLPEIGIGGVGIFDIYYGYAFPLQKFEFGAIGRNRISLTVNYPVFKKPYNHKRL